MARINIEETWWSESRRNNLGKLLTGIHFYPADLIESVMVRAWRGAQEYWQKGELVPGRIFLTFLASDAILLSGLARIHTGPSPDSPILEMPSNLRFIERVPNEIRTTSNEIRTAVNDYLTTAERNWIYVNGSETSFKWALNARRQRSEAGKKSAEKRRLRTGSAQPSRTKPERDRTAPNETPTEINEIERSGSGSGSVSGSRSRSGSGKNNGGIRAVYPAEFESVWKAYVSVRGDKKASHEIWKDYTDSEKADLTPALKHFQLDNPDPQYRPGLEVFLKKDWRPWIQGTVGKVPYSNGHANGRLNPFKEKLAELEAQQQTEIDEVFQ